MSVRAHVLYIYHEHMINLCIANDTELDQKARELEQQRRQDEAERALAEAQKRRELEANYRCAKFCSKLFNDLIFYSSV